MERGMIVFWGGMMLIIALFIPLAILQDSGSAAVVKGKKEGKRCSPFVTPQAVVGRFSCQQKRKNSHGELHACRLLCPASMQPRPRKHRVIHRCHKGRWSGVKQDHVQCVAKKSVALVEQQSASPALLNTLMFTYLNLTNNYLAMAYFFDRADVQLPGYHKYFLHLWQTTMDQARSVMAYINKRGGWIDMQDLPRPAVNEILDMGHEAGRVGLVAMETAMSMETESQREILKLTDFMEKPKNYDPHMLHTLEDKHLTYKVKIIKELKDYVTQLRAFEQTGEDDYKLGEYEMDGVLQ
ncbi:soma ferritin-like [Babylonia areolata]|uniref:soma ferritin-like n=1 Tax=Babylonia areolata TaxID=304850 RepID=UPI003FD1E095